MATETFLVGSSCACTFGGHLCGTIMFDTIIFVGTVHGFIKLLEHLWVSIIFVGTMCGTIVFLTL